MVKLIQHDLEFILNQIKIAEAHSAAIENISGEDATAQIGDALRELVDSPLLPIGLRTVDGSHNNLVPGRETWGASGEPFPQLSQPNWVNENDDVIVFGAGSPGEVSFSDGNYGEHGAPTGVGGLGGGTLVDADPRTISNLIVDQTLANPAAIAAALRHAGLAEADIPTAIDEIRTAYLNQPDFSEALENAQNAVEVSEAAVSQAMQDLADAEMPAELPPLLEALTAAQGAAALAQAELAQVEEDAAAFTTLLEQHGIQMDGNTVKLPNVSPDEGLSAPYNSWFTLFGQFFDHGLDLVAKGGNGTIYIPLQPDDPLYDPASPHTNFMVLTRATIGEDAGNVTTPWVDQNQTYTSHASHQVFLREYEIGAEGKPVSTGLLLESVNGGLATWKDIKDQAREMLGIELTDADVGMVPLLRTDPYGNFIPDPVTGFAQVIVGVGGDGVPNTSDDEVISGTPAAPVNLESAIRIPNAFLDDIAHAAVPVVDANGLLQDDDDSVGYSGEFNARGQQTAYDNEMLDAHYVTGDGRGNENIGLTAVHFVFHAEHNRQIEEIKATVLATGDADFIAEWQLADGSWNGERLFQAARFSTEMQYQHLVFEEFARKIQPDVDIFIVQPDVELNPAIFAEFANVVYRFGHSMLNQTVDRTYQDGTQANIDLFEAFLNPLAFGDAGISQAEMAGAIALGMSAQRGNEIDEFVTDVLRNQLVGIPLDLAALNIARGRDTGMPTLNQARAQFQEMANGDTLLRPYTSWSDFAVNLKNPESIINFIAAYGTHATIEAQAAIAGKRDAAMELVFGVDMDGDGVVPADRLEFLNATGEYAAALGGLDNVDLWVGGLAEKKMAFGGMLGSTFSFVFQLQMENLQDSDRFYYLSRTQGLNMLTELENNSLAKIVMRNTNLDDNGLALPADIFSVPDHILYMDLARQMALTGLVDPAHENPVLQAISKLVERIDNDADGVAEYIRYNGLDHIVIQGTNADDHIVSGGGDDTVWGRDGNDRIEAGYGVDNVNGGAGDDIITSAGTDIGAVTVIKGESGNDVVVDGTGLSLIFGGTGKDYLVSGADDGEIRGGQDADFIFGGDGAGMLFGNEGDDWIEAGGGFDYIAGDNGELFFNSTIIGHDVLDGGSGDTDYDADSGDDIMFSGEGIQKNIGMWGHDWVTHQGEQTGADADMRVDIFTTLPLEVLRDRFSEVEALSGWHHDDVLRGDDRTGNDGDGGTVADPTPETGFRYDELNQAAIDRIDGLDQIITSDMMVEGQYWANGSWENGQTGTTEDIFVGGNILLGGGGSDLIEGRGGDDVIDGDRFLNVRIRGESRDGVAFSVTSLEDNVTMNGVTKSLTAWMLEGEINPGHLEVVREILNGNQEGDEDTAIYWDVRENYEITSNSDGSYTVEHVDQTGGAIDPVTGRNRESDGTDRLYNIERVGFADGIFDLDALAPPPNSPATGTPTISDLTPTEGQTLTADTSSITDANGLGAMSYQWQMSSDGGTTWTNAFDNLQLTSDATFTPNSGILGIGGQVGNLLRVVVNFTDGQGNLESLVSLPTQVVGDEWQGVAFSTFNGTEGDDVANGANFGLLGSNNDTLNGNGGDDVLNGNGGNDTIDGGAGNDRIIGGAGNDTINQTSNNGRDLIDGGNGSDTYRLTGAAGSEVFRIYAITSGQNAGLAAALGTTFATATEIVVTRTVSGVEAVIAELDNIEEIVVNTLNVSANDGGGPNQGDNGGDSIQVVGNFNSTSLNFSTITIEGGEGDDEVDITSLLSAHRIVFKSNGGNDTIIGTLRPQDVIELAPGTSIGDYALAINADGSKTMWTTGHSVTYFGTSFFEANNGVEAADPETDQDMDPNSAPATSGATRIGTAAGEALAGGEGDDTLAGDGGDDTILGAGGDDNLAGGIGNDILVGGGGSDILIGNDGDDAILAGTGDDTALGGAGDDIINGQDGNDLIFGDAGRDVVDAGQGNDTLFATIGDGDDVYNGALGTDTLDMSAISANITVDLGSSGSGLVVSDQTGIDTVTGIENVIGGSGNDTFIASSAVNVFTGGAGGDTFVFSTAQAANGDRIEDFRPGDQIDLQPLYESLALDGAVSDYVTDATTFTEAGQLRLVVEGDDTLVLGTTDDDPDAEFAIRIVGRTDLNENDFA